MTEEKRRRRPYTADAPRKKVQTERQPQTPSQTDDIPTIVKYKYKELPYTLAEMRLKPRSPEYLHRLAQELVEWSATDDAFKLSQFFSERFVVRDVWQRWIQDSPALQDAMDIAKENIGNRREMKALKGEYNASIVMTTMPLHCKEYKEWRVSMKPKEEQDKRDIRVFIEPFRVEPKKVESMPLPEHTDEGDQGA